MAVTVEQVWDALRNVHDPEIHISVVDLGLVYGVEVPSRADGKTDVHVKMTLTTPACPYGPALLSRAHAAVSALPGVNEANIELVWIPQWDPRKMASDEAKMQMGFFEIDEPEPKKEETSASPKTNP